MTFVPHVLAASPLVPMNGVFLAQTWLQWILQPSSWAVILQVAVGLGFVIFVHELGHFLVAKACGVKCEKFFIGFDIGGLKLASVTWGETEYGIGILPLGGYVKMLGQDDNPASTAEESRRARASGDLPPEPTADGQEWDPRSYPAQSVPERMAIISAGVTMNVLLAVVMASFAFWLGVRELTCEVSSVRPGGAAWRAGMRTGDQIVGIGAIDDPIFTDLQRGVTLGNSTEGVAFRVHRPGDDTTRTLTIQPDTDLGIPTVGVTSPFSTTISRQLPGADEPPVPGALSRAEPPLMAGDRIVAVDGQPTSTYADLIAALSQRLDDDVRLTVVREPTVGGDSGSKQVEIRAPFQPRRSLGLTMTPGSVRAVQADSPADAAGIRVGDQIVTMDEETLIDPLTFDAKLRGFVGQSVRLGIRRGDGVEAAESDLIDLTVQPRDVTWVEEARWPSSPMSVPSLGLAIDIEPIVTAVAADGPAAAAGINAGDRVVRASFLAEGRSSSGEGLEMTGSSHNWPYLESLLQVVATDTSIRLAVESSQGETREVDIVPVDSKDLFLVDRGLVFEPVYRTVRASSLLSALSKGGRRTLEELSGVYRFLRKLTRSEISPRLLGGPIAIAQQAGRSAEEGFGRFLLFLTMLSANLAVVNFLPIPVLDGGHMVFLLYELVTGRRPSERVVVTLSYLGLVLLLSLMVFVFGLDLGLIPRR